MPNVTLIAMIAGILLMSYISHKKLQMFAGKSPPQNISLKIHLQSPTTWQLVWKKLGLCKKKEEKKREMVLITMYAFQEAIL